MKKISKLFSYVCLFLTVFSYGLGIVSAMELPASVTVNNVNPATDTWLGPEFDPFGSVVKTSKADGRYVFCLDSDVQVNVGVALNRSDSLYQDQQGKMAEVSKIVSTAYRYGLGSGYGSSELGLTEQELYGVTQMAIWHVIHGTGVNGYSVNHQKWINYTANRQNAFNVIRNYTLAQPTISLEGSTKLVESNDSMVSENITVNATGFAEGTTFKLTTSGDAYIIVDGNRTQSVDVINGTAFVVNVKKGESTNVSATVNVTSPSVITGAETAFYAAKTPGYQNIGYVVPTESVLTNKIDLAGSYVKEEKKEEKEEKKEKEVLVSKTDATGQNEIPGASMTLYDQNGSLKETWESGTTAHKISGLVVGEIYEIVENVAPEGYVAISTSIKFRMTETGKAETMDCKSVNGNGSGIDVSSCKVMSTEDKLNIKNDVTKIKISKVDISNGEELPGATLRITNLDGSPVYQDGKILEWVSTSEAHYIEMLPVGKYKLIETIVPEGYVATTSEIVFEVKAETGIQTVKFENDVTKVMISKRDFTTGEEIPGAHLQIIDVNGNVVAEWVSKTEPEYITKLPVGKYVLVETLPSTGYNSEMIIDGKTTSRYEFEITDGEIVKIDVYNQVMEVPITGMSATGTYLIGSMVMFVGLGTITVAKKKNKEVC